MTDISIQTTNAAVRALTEQRQWCVHMLVAANPDSLLAEDYRSEVAELDAALAVLAREKVAG